ncbi:NAD/NADP octopine/nopaline dehydrogenase family protein [uncultured Oscillibacter sp.]|uniref:NAD/NADP octopine/nopaline dehydrogenase family protein n=1 Tax=uncultured Oscillibacter sp. TaxID=876091 RepID=UPI002607E094|nr:NAD/NADP octopine/nopaline dehydrogenase family protein [uncultured Oscillibacter sp.]
MATLPAGDIGRLMDVLGPVFPCLEPVAGVLETGFEGAGAMLHPIPSLMNVNKMDLGESYDYYMEGITPHIAEIITACDPKRVAVCRALGVEAMPLGDMLVKTYKLEPKIASTALCLLGAYIAMQPSFDSNPLPLLAALSAAVVAGIAYTMLPYCKNFTAPSVIIFHFSLLSTVCSAVLLLPSFVVPPLPVCFMLLMVGVFAAGGQFLLTYAYRHAPASEVSIYQYAGVVFTAGLSYFAFGEALSGSSILGGVVILGAIFWVFESQRKSSGS